MITNEEVKEIAILNDLSEQFSANNLSDELKEYYSNLVKKYRPINVLAVLLNEIRLLEKIRGAQSKTIQDLMVYKYKFEELINERR